MIIRINEFTNEAASKAKGIMLKELIEKNIGDTDLIIDFTGITRFASPFFNNSFSALGIQYGFGTIEKIELLNISDNGKLVFDSSIENAKFLTDHNDQKKKRLKILPIVH